MPRYLLYWSIDRIEEAMKTGDVSLDFDGGAVKSGDPVMLRRAQVGVGALPWGQNVTDHSRLAQGWQ